MYTFPEIDDFMTVDFSLIVEEVTQSQGEDIFFHMELTIVLIPCVGTSENLVF